MQYILDPKFREQFEVAHPTPRYRKVMEGVGQEVLATPDRLTRVSGAGAGALEHFAGLGRVSAACKCVAGQIHCWFV